jgi:hypothetical protein
MPSDIVAAIDQTAANTLLGAWLAAENASPPSTSGSAALGPLTVGYTASATFAGGSVVLSAPDTVAIDNLQVDYSLTLALSIDLSFLDFCLPQICIPTPFGNICTPTICFDFPTIPVTVPFSSSVTLSADFGIEVELMAGTWFVNIVIQSVPQLDLGPAALLLLTAIGAAIAAVVAVVPFIGPLLSIAVAIIVGAFGLADVTGLLGPIVSALVSGLTFNVYQQPQDFQVLPASPPFDPAVMVTLASVAAGVQASDKNELVLSVDI